MPQQVFKEIRDIQKFQKKLELNLQKKIKNLIETNKPDLKNYYNNQTQYNERKFCTSNQKMFFQQIKKSDLIFIGDHHPSNLTQKIFQLIIKKFIHQISHFSVGIEFIHQEHQKFLDAYLLNQINEEEFLYLINYKKLWNFPFENYYPIIKLCKKLKIPLIALNSKLDLFNRDYSFGQTIKNYLVQHKRNKMIVILGELHVYPNKVPLITNFIKPIGKPSNIKMLERTIIYQNLTDPFWKFSPGKKPDLIQFNDNEFCFYNASPWEKLHKEFLLYEKEDNVTEFIIELLLFLKNHFKNEFSSISSSCIKNACETTIDQKNYKENPFFLAKKIMLNINKQNNRLDYFLNEVFVPFYKQSFKDFENYYDLPKIG